MDWAFKKKWWLLGNMIPFFPQINRMTLKLTLFIGVYLYFSSIKYWWSLIDRYIYRLSWQFITLGFMEAAEVIFCPGYEPLRKLLVVFWKLKYHLSTMTILNINNAQLLSFFKAWCCMRKVKLYMLPFEIFTSFSMMEIFPTYSTSMERTYECLNCMIEGDC